MDVTVTPAAPADLDQLAELYLAARHTFLPFAPSPHSDLETRRWLRDILYPTGGLATIRDCAQIVGLVATSDDGQRRWIDQLYLAPGRAGAGVGTRVLAQVLPRLSPPVRLYTFQANEGARRFYERHGFAAVAFGDGSGNEERCPDVLYERW